MPSKAERILSEGWEYGAPALAKVLAALLWLMILESLRRTSGWPMAVIVTVVSLYPVFADDIPNPLKGNPQTLSDTLAYHLASAESRLRHSHARLRRAGDRVPGLGTALQYSGAGAFFINLAFALCGTYRGGAAKVAIFSSGLLGSMSGSVISNVLTTGTMTIPAMKKHGLQSRSWPVPSRPCASTGVALAPPVMGATAFVMAEFLNIPYAEVALAAAVPAAYSSTSRFSSRSTSSRRAPFFHGRHAARGDAAPARRRARRLVLSYFLRDHPAGRAAAPAP